MHLADCSFGAVDHVPSDLPIEEDAQRLQALVLFST